MTDQINDTELTPSEDFIRGFNEGYLLAEHIPHIAKKLKGIEATTERLTGLKGGIDQYDLDHDYSLYPEWMKDHFVQLHSGKEKNKDLDKDKEREKDMDRE